MISIKSLEKTNNLVELVDLGADELDIRGGNPRAIGAAAGAVGGVIGTASFNASTNKPLQTGLLENAAIGGAFGARNPVGGVASFGVEAGKAAAGAFGVPTALNALSRPSRPEIAAPTTGGGGRGIRPTQF